MNIKSIKNARGLVGKKVLVRVDFNEPVKNGIVEDDYKIMMQIPTVRFLLSQKCKVILLTHLGRPSVERREREFSVEPIAKRVEELLSLKFSGEDSDAESADFKGLKFVDEVVGFKVGNEVAKMKEGEVLILENVRYEKGEMENSVVFARKLAKLADIYVNEAFAASHRAHASVSAIKKYIPSYAGLLLTKEVENLYKIRSAKSKLVVVIGGAKLATKIPLIKRFEKRASHILIGGALASNFLKARGYEIGKSLSDEESVKMAGKINYNNIVLPVDLVTNTRRKGGKVQIKNPRDVKKSDYIFDYGPKTIRLYSSFIKKAENIIWNGPMGCFEVKAYSGGTLAMARSVATRSCGKAFGVVGGGETVEALKRVHEFNGVDWISTGGGAMLSYLGKEKMPGLKGIVR